MNKTGPRPRMLLQLPTLKQESRPTVADQVFDILQQRILTLELPPRFRLSETEVAKQMGVSRQPVREAFKRLARLGFLEIRPQSGTMVSLISKDSVVRAQFIRAALEVQTIHVACKVLGEPDLKALGQIIQDQKQAVIRNDPDSFHALDDQFHREICQRSGVGFVWELITEHKPHMDRIRVLSLSNESQKVALDEHMVIFDALAARDDDAASEAMIVHLSKILVLAEQTKAKHRDWFMDPVA